MKSAKELQRKRARRVKRTRSRISGDAKNPRLAVFRSNRFMYAQLIDDVNGKTILSASVRDLNKDDRKKPKKEQAKFVGSMIAKKAIEKGIKSAVFDRRSYQYHGRVEAVATGAREGGLKI